MGQWGEVDRPLSDLNNLKRPVIILLDPLWSAARQGCRVHTHSLSLAPLPPVTETVRLTVQTGCPMSIESLIGAARMMGNTLE